MSNLTDADSITVGSQPVSKVYLGAQQIWPSAASVPVVISGAPTTGTAVNGTSATITLPNYAEGDYLLLIVSRNQADGAAWVGDSNASVTEIVHNSRRLSLLKVNPIAAASSFSIVASTSALWSWCCVNLGSINPSIQSEVNNIANSTTSSLEFSSVNTTAVTDGNELVIAVASTNSTAAWTPPAGVSTQYAYGGAPGLLVASYAPSGGLTTVSTIAADRGNNGVNRYESSIVSVIRA